jgi:hypothetical protein
VLGEISITIAISRPAPRFRLTGLNGGVPRVTFLVVTDVPTQEVVWWLVPPGFVSVAPFRVGEVDERAVPALAASDELDPIEDLPPSDPRHQRGHKERESLERNVLIPLGAVTYGEIPPGFRQARPETGHAPALVPDREYVLMVMGSDGDAGHCPFRGV